MNKSELINAVAVSADVSKKEAEAVITAALDAITAALSLRSPAISSYLRSSPACLTVSGWSIPYTEMLSARDLRESSSKLLRGCIAFANMSSVGMPYTLSVTFSCGLEIISKNLLSSLSSSDSISVIALGNTVSPLDL